MTDRRTFLAAPMFGAAAFALHGGARADSAASAARVVSTWDFGVAANRAGWTVLRDGGRALDAVEAGARVPEADLKNHSVGRAGCPDRDGHVSLDASIMDGVRFLALSRSGEVGAWALQPGFNYAVCDAGRQDALLPARSGI
jgi:N4-(beta-N-acetylglucosaminyl)-L-asparaginase